MDMKPSKRRTPKHSISRFSRTENYKIAMRERKKKEIREEKKAKMEMEKEGSSKLYKTVKIQRNDIYKKIVRGITVIGWVMFFVFIAVIEQARPKEANFWNRHFGNYPAQSWNEGLLETGYRIQMMLFVLCSTGLLINLIGRAKYKNRVSASVLILGIFGLMGTLTYFFKHNP